MNEINNNPIRYKILFFFTLLIGTLSLFSLFSFMKTSDFYSFFNSDTLYLPSIYKDIFVEHNRLSDWYINPSPNFFPDMMLYFLLMSIFNNFIVVSYLFPIVQFWIISVFIYLLFKNILIERAYLYASISSILLLTNVFVAFFSNDFGFTFYLVSNSYHTGAFTMGLICLVMSFIYVNRQKKVILGALVALIILSVVSDRLFIVLYSIPVFVFIIYLLNKNYKPLILKLLTANILSTLIGLFVFTVIKRSKIVKIPPPFSMFNLDNIGGAYRIFSEQMWQYITDFNFKTLIIFLTVLSLLFSIWQLFLHGTKRRIIKNDNLLIYHLFAICYIVFVLWVPVFNGNYTGWDTLRYNIYSFYFGLINASLIIYVVFEKSAKLSKFVPLFLYLCLGILALVSLTKYSGSGLKQNFSHYPEEVRKIDSICVKNNLKMGVAGYWTAKKTSMFTREGVRVYAVYDNLNPYHHVVNGKWFHNDTLDFTFYIPSSLGIDSVRDSFFEEKHIKHQSGDLIIIETAPFRYNPTDFSHYFVDEKQKQKSR